MTGTFEKIYAIVRLIPPGKVAYYGQIAALAGLPRGARIVGYAMASCADGRGVPCHRVVDKQGNTKAAFDVFQVGAQRARLEAEGVPFLPDGRVDLAACLWDGQGAHF
ncbi:MAG: MGMT family protein [Clostridia bacterium]|nr:MGMT family protein [Clostridia bacterium]